MSYRIQKGSQRARGSTVICLFCGETLSSASALRLHKIAKHPSKFHGCHRCDEKFTDMVSLSKHLDQVHDQGTNCNECDATFREMSSLRKHKQSFHGEFPCTDSNCKHKLHTLKHLRTHIKQYHDIKFRNESTCKTCSRHLKGGKNALAYHMNSIHWLETFKDKSGKTEDNGDNKSDFESIPVGKLSITNKMSGSGGFLRTPDDPTASGIEC